MKNTLDCPINFDYNYSAPLFTNHYNLRFRVSDTINERGIALLSSLNYHTFSEWISKKDIETIQPLMEAGREFTGEIITRELFLWHPGGGLCQRGRVCIYKTPQY